MLPGRHCPNTACCKGKGIDGCWECGELTACRKGFYAYDDINAIKAMAVFIRKYGKKELAAVLDRLRRQHDYEKIQEVLGNDLEQALMILEQNRQV